MLAHGKKLYNIYCTACHGTYGDGDGKVVVREAGKGLKPPSLHSSKLKEWPDGRIYSGNYELDKKKGFGIYKWPDGKKYEGYWQNGV